MTSIRSIRNRALKAIGHTDYRRFIILSRSRVGSNLITTYLDSHPNVHAEGEIVRRLKGRDYADVVAQAFGREPRSIKAKGFKIFYYHPIDDKRSPIWDLLIGMEGLHVIHMKRRNVLRTLISREIAEREGVWRTSGGRPPGNGDKRVTFSVEELREGFERTRRSELLGEARFVGHPLISVYYEDLVHDTAATFRGVTDFLGVPFVQPRTNLVRQNPEGVKDLVKNYEELAAAFAGSEWESFFEG